MRESRNMAVIVLLIVAILWAFAVWVVIPGTLPSLTLPAEMAHKIVSLTLVVAVGLTLFWVLKFEDRLSDDLAKVNFGQYYEQDGLCFLPMIRVQPKGDAYQAEISLYYQNRFSGPCEAVIHLRPPPGSFFSHHGKRDVHFAFNCKPGAFGVIHQPVAVAHEFQGLPVHVLLAAAVRYPHGHGERLRSTTGMECGTFDVDWALAFRQSEHELSGEIELKDPAKINLVLPENVTKSIKRSEYKHELIAGIPEEAAL